MKEVKWTAKRLRRIAMGAAMIVFIGQSGAAFAEDVTVALSGQNEIPPVTTPATGTGTLTIGPDKSVSGKVTVTGMSGTVAHIHEAAVGSNGAIIIPLTKSSDNAWVVPTGTKLTDAQYESYKAGDLYVNVHSAANKGGEIRGQLKP